MRRLGQAMATAGLAALLVVLTGGNGDAKTIVSPWEPVSVAPAVAMRTEVEADRGGWLDTPGGPAVEPGRGEDAVPPGAGGPVATGRRGW